MTPWEAKLWYHLRGNRFYGFKFKRQVPMGNYVADFCCQEKLLIVELDGGHHSKMGNKDADNKRQEYLAGKDYKILRFWNSEVDKNMQGVLDTIRVNLF
jgi:very-short-patch-repair endonuclease